MSRATALLPEFEKWQADLAETIAMIFVSRGDADENNAKFQLEIAAAGSFAERS